MGAQFSPVEWSISVAHVETRLPVGTRELLESPASGVASASVPVGTRELLESPASGVALPRVPVGTRELLGQVNAAQLVLVLCVFTWGAYQCFWNLAAANIGPDEPVYLKAGLEYIRGDFSYNREHPPTVKFLLGIAQLLLGEGQIAGRVLTALAAYSVGVILWFWLRREIGWAGAITAAGFWLILPHGFYGNVRLDRITLLEPFMVLFVVAAMASAWRWWRTGSLWYAAAAGLLFALSVTSKVTAIVMIPVFILLMVIRRPWKKSVCAAVLFMIIGCAAAVALYAPMDIQSALTYMVDYQSAHNGNGHLVSIAGMVTRYPPWWANLWFLAAGMGAIALIVVGGLTTVSLLSRYRVLTAYLAVALGLLVVFYLVISRVALPHYYYAWVWLLCALAGVGVSVLLTGRNGATTLVNRRRKSIQTLTLVAVILFSLISGITASVRVWNERPAGAALVSARLADAGLSKGLIYVEGLAGWEFVPYLGSRITSSLQDASLVGIIIGLGPTDSVPPSPEFVRALINNPDIFEAVKIDRICLFIIRDKTRALTLLARVHN
ncbi:MAG: hypothetical protein B5766_12335 [Candidatus Lumbricidophila eiseniae]|uniref:Glycosyltransferase RgtA/B/C/D-like domain-containing protein n=1 Tax=Candidatus Lumbricidiphila eiseniae TaxID=1969409 RepID=A0A2A6FNF9_9MICO|nr:MAG: hypothetical protein B5766_12335 [Candidatus Lumbricidophila eiseniae]